MSFRLANLRHLFGLVLLLGALLLGSAGALAKEAHALGHPSASASVLTSAALDQMQAADEAPSPQQQDDDDRCALEDNSFDDTLKLPEDLVMNLHVIASARLTGPVPALAGVPLVRELRPPIV